MCWSPEQHVCQELPGRRTAPARPSRAPGCLQEVGASENSAASPGIATSAL